MIQQLSMKDGCNQKTLDEVQDALECDPEIGDDVKK